MASPFKLFLKFSFGTWINAVISLISIPILTWFIDPAETGKATIFTISYNLLLNVLLLGIDQSFVRYFNDRKSIDHGNLLFNAVAPTGVMIIISVGILESFRHSLSLIFFASAEYAYIVDMLSISLAAGCVNRYAFLILRMQKKAIAYSAAQVTLSLCNIALTIGFVIFVSQTFVSVVLGFAASQVIAMMIAVWMESGIWKKMLSVRSQLDISLITQLLSYGIPFIPTLAFDWIFQSSDRTFLRIYSTFEEVGIYATASRVASALNILQTSFSTFWIPFVFERFSNDESDKNFYPTIFNAVAIAFLIAIQMAVAVKGFIHYLLPESYHESVEIFTPLLFVPMFYALSDITSVGINIRKKTIYHFYVLIVASAVSVMAGFLLIPALGAKGAVVSSFLSFATFFFMRTILGHLLYPLPIDWHRFTGAAIVTLLLAGVAFVNPSFPIAYFCLPCVILTLFAYKSTLKNLILQIKTLR